MGDGGEANEQETKHEYLPAALFSISPEGSGCKDAWAARGCRATGVFAEVEVGRHDPLCNG